LVPAPTARVPYEGASPPQTPPLGEFLEAAADGRVRARDVVAVDAEQAAVGVLDVAATNVEARDRRVEVPVIARVRRIAAVRRSGNEQREPAIRLHCKLGGVAVRRGADTHAVGAVAELVGILDDVQAAAVVIATVHPVVHVIPQALDVAVLAATIRGAGVLRGAGVVRHTVRRAHVELAATWRTAVPDFRLRVPVGELYDVEQPDGKAHGEVHLPDVRAEIMDAGPSRRTGDVGFGLTTGLAFPVARVAVIATDVHDIALALAIAPVHVGGGNRKAALRSVGDLDFQAVAVLGQLVPELRDGDHRTAGALALDHARPRLQIVEGRAVLTCALHIRHGVSEARRLIGAGPLGRAAAIPARAVDVDHVGHIDRKGLVGGSVVVRASRDLYGYSHVALIERGDVYLVAADRHADDIGVAGRGGNHTVTDTGHGDSASGRISVQRQRSRIEAQRASSLGNAPRHGLGCGGAVAPLVAGLRSEAGVVAARVGAAGRAAQCQLGAVVIVERGGLRLTGVDQALALRRDGRNGDFDGGGVVLAGLRHVDLYGRRGLAGNCGAYRVFAGLLDRNRGNAAAVCGGTVDTAAEDSLCLRTGGGRDRDGRGEHGQRDFILAKVRAGGHGCGILLARRGARADGVLRVAVLDADGIHKTLRHGAGFGVSRAVSDRVLLTGELSVERDFQNTPGAAAPFKRFVCLLQRAVGDGANRFKLRAADAGYVHTSIVAHRLTPFLAESDTSQRWHWPGPARHGIGFSRPASRRSGKSRRPP